MRVTVSTFASLRELSVDRCELALDDGATLADAWTELQRQFAGIEPHRPYVRAARNGVYAAWDDRLADDDVIAFLPPVSGGAGGGLTDAPIDVAALEAAVAGPGHGAVVTFVGRARDVADDGRTVTELEYEVYPEMAASVLDEIAVEAETRFGVSVVVVHRFGVVPIGEAAVAIVSAARHRTEAYESNRFVIEAIKERLPIWKRERFADGSEWKRPGA
ncbi:MAG: molybdenum cofactor biosynthesis protein MoaE [Chloroflexi bacterium]|nr:molybdenum cofactor biosynthesis protein MoaE [Chloroflexota bacterium]MBA3740088.1 molybdenum cofactor biosynthesis protein MoaE [Chloroflexota bacterium]